MKVKKNILALALLFGIHFSHNATMTMFSVSEQPERNLQKKGGNAPAAGREASGDGPGLTQKSAY